jgi:rubredoxin
MSGFTCKLCNYIFKTKFSLERHQNKKTKCNLKTEFKCEKCNKSFKTNQNLNYHIDNTICDYLFIENKENKENNIDKTIIDILEGEEENKIFLLKMLGLNIEDEDINKIIISKISNESKINIIKNKILTKNNIINSNNTNSNNTTNNIQINSFGNEKTDYLTNEYFTKLLQNNYGKDSFLKLSNEIYLNNDKPENNTIRVDNLDNKWCKIIENNKWITTTKDSAKEKIFSKVSDIILLILDDVKDKVPKEKRKIIADFLEKDVDDTYIKETLAEMIVKIYNFYDK